VGHDAALVVGRVPSVETARALDGLEGRGEPYPGAAEFTSNPFNPPLGSGLTAPLLDELALRGNVDVSGGLWRNWNPALIGDPMDDEIFHPQAFIKSLFLDSQMTVGLLAAPESGVPSQNGLLLPISSR
jgi:hypothetical protein